MGVEATREAIAAISPERLLQAQAQLRDDLVARPEPEFWGEGALSYRARQPRLGLGTEPPQSLATVKAVLGEPGNVRFFFRHGLPWPDAGHRTGGLRVACHVHATDLIFIKATGPRSLLLKERSCRWLVEQRRTHRLFDVAVAEVPAPAQLGRDALLIRVGLDRDRHEDARPDGLAGLATSRN
jgi:hypothetical protein